MRFILQFLECSLEGFVSTREKGLAYPYRCHAYSMIVVRQFLNDQFGVNGIHSLQCPEGVDAAKRRLSGAGMIFQLGNDGLTILSKYDQLLGSVAPPAVRMGKVSDKLFGRLPEHGGLWTRFVILVNEAVDSSFTDILVDLPLVYDPS